MDVLFLVLENAASVLDTLRLQFAQQGMLENGFFVGDAHYSQHFTPAPRLLQCLFWLTEVAHHAWLRHTGAVGKGHRKALRRDRSLILLHHNIHSF